MKKIISPFLILLFLTVSLNSIENISSNTNVKETVKLNILTKKIILEGFPNAHNPSLVQDNESLILTFRYLPDEKQPWISYVGIVRLNEALDIISEPQLLDTRIDNQITPSQSEDARIFSYNNELYLLFNDNTEVINPTTKERRDIYICKVDWKNDQFETSTALKLIHETKYPNQLWQKNWIPFIWNDQLFLTYSVKPHEILMPDLLNGISKSIYVSDFDLINWKWGQLRGGTQAELLDGEYIAFFHCSKPCKSLASNGKMMHHYYMGAYTFSKDPPFEITKMTPTPIIAKGFYTKSDCDKRVIFPGGLVISDSNIHVAYGKDDREVWIATFDKDQLKNFLIPVKKL